jgi:IclR family KDG regulon transcriptional repressor
VFRIVEYQNRSLGCKMRVRESGQTVQSVERALRILECFKLEKQEQSLGEIAQQTKLSKSTVSRLLGTLAGCGFIKQNPMNQRYGLGFKLFHLGAVVAGSMNLRTTALPFMQELSDEFSETVDLNIVERDERVCIEVVESKEQIRNFVKVGQRNSLYLGASGKVLLAFLDEEKRKKIISDAARENHLPLEINQFDQELKKIQLQGYALTIDERIKGAFSIAAPIFDYEREIIGGLTIAGPTLRLTEERMPLLIQAVVHSAHKISEAMGYPGEKMSLTQQR